MMELSIEISIKIRFSDTDAMGVVWHGNYLRFFEDGREAFGKKFDFEYLSMYENGFFTPIVKSEISHKNPIFYGDEVKLIARYKYQRAAKLIFEYEIINVKTNAICAVGSTTQVFLSVESRELELTCPDFYTAWKEKYFR